MTVARHISRSTYKNAKTKLDQLIEGVWIVDKSSGRIAYKEKPDINAIKYAIDKFDEQLEKKKYGG